MSCYVCHYVSFLHFGIRRQCSGQYQENHISVYVTLRFINCVHIYLFTFARTSFALLHMFMLTGVRENAHDIVCRARWVFSELVSESSPRLSGSGWIQTLK